jgi:hypothetical protein
MPEFLDVLESIRADEADVRRLYGDAGTSSRGRRRSPDYDANFDIAFNLYESVLRGNRRAALDFQEAMATDDFPYLFGDILDRQLLGSYQEYPSTWRSYCRRGTVRDFRNVKRFYTNGGSEVLPEVPEGAEYEARDIDEGKYEYSVSKRGSRMPFTWETFINDDLDALRDAPARLGRAGGVSEDKFVTELYADSSGPDATFFSSANKNRATGAGSALSISSLQTAMGAVMSQVDSDGNPIFTDMVTLVVPPSLEITARNILNATEIRVATGGGGSSAADQLVAQNWMRSRVELVVNPWLPLVDTTKGTTAWYLFAAPSAGRPALEVGFLRGHETPEVFVKAPNAQRVGGGAVAAEDGDFGTDSIDYKVRHVFGGVLMDPKSAYAAEGAA